MEERRKVVELVDVGDLVGTLCKDGDIPNQVDFCAQEVENYIRSLRGNSGRETEEMRDRRRNDAQEGENPTTFTYRGILLGDGRTVYLEYERPKSQRDLLSSLKLMVGKKIPEAEQSKILGLRLLARENESLDDIANASAELIGQKCKKGEDIEVINLTTEDSLLYKPENGSFEEEKEAITREYHLKKACVIFNLGKYLTNFQTTYKDEKSFDEFYAGLDNCAKNLMDYLKANMVEGEIKSEFTGKTGVFKAEFGKSHQKHLMRSELTFIDGRKAIVSYVKLGEDIYPKEDRENPGSNLARGDTIVSLKLIVDNPRHFRDFEEMLSEEKPDKEHPMRGELDGMLDESFADPWYVYKKKDKKTQDF